MQRIRQVDGLELGSMQHDFGIGRSFERGVDTGEVADFTGPRLFV